MTALFLEQANYWLLTTDCLAITKADFWKEDYAWNECLRGNVYPPFAP